MSDQDTFDVADDELLDQNGRRTQSLSRQKRLGSDGVTYPIGFFNFTFNEANGTGLGGMLVTDNTGIPLEFMVTTAVRTTAAQRILYGKRLRSFIAVNLCAKQLLQNIKTKPKVLFVRDEWLLSVCQQTEVPVLQLIPSAQLDNATGRPTVMAPDQYPEYTEVIDLTSLDADMVDAFDRIENCRKQLAIKNAEYSV